MDSDMGSEEVTLTCEICEKEPEHELFSCPVCGMFVCNDCVEKDPKFAEGVEVCVVCLGVL